MTVEPELKEHLLCKANEVFVVSVDVGELDVYQQQNLQRKMFNSRVSVQLAYLVHNTQYAISD